jgi:hypothetical protein
MKLEKTKRGFLNGTFTDRYGAECSIQKSSLATEDAIWLGIDNPKLTVFEDEKMGAYITTSLPKNWMVESRMHLTREMVEELLPILQNFVATGELS